MSGSDRVRSIHDLDDWSLEAVTAVAAREPVDLGTFCDEEVVLLDRGAPSMLDAPRLSQWDEGRRDAARTAVTALLVSRGDLVVTDEIEVWGTMAPLHDLRAAASERVVLHPLPPETATLFAVVERLGDSDLATVRLVDPGDGIHWVVVTTILRAMAIAMGRLGLLSADDLPDDLDRLRVPEPEVQWARDPVDLVPDPILLATEADQAVVVLVAEPGGGAPDELGTLTAGPRGLHLVAEVGGPDDVVHTLTTLAPGEALGLLGGAVRGMRAGGLARPDARTSRVPATPGGHEVPPVGGGSTDDPPGADPDRRTEPAAADDDADERRDDGVVDHDGGAVDERGDAGDEAGDEPGDAGDDAGDEPGDAGDEAGDEPGDAGDDAGDDHDGGAVGDDDGAVGDDGHEDGLDEPGDDHDGGDEDDPARGGSGVE